MYTQRLPHSQAYSAQTADAVVIDAPGFNSQQSVQQTVQQSGGLVGQDSTRIQAPETYDVGVVVVSSDSLGKTPLIQQTSDSIVVHSNKNRPAVVNGRKNLKKLSSPSQFCLLFRTQSNF